ncbi:hypothetical protein AHF37_08273 [Paragonimus kellicotti]|nr:hypothetical protein AHF37_08273 [Paragonimus kellicotti]
MQVLRNYTVTRKENSMKVTKRLVKGVMQSTMNSSDN